MLLYNEQLQQTTLAAFRQQILDNLDDVAVPNDAELESDLTGYYNQAAQLDVGQYHANLIAPSLGGIGKRILEKIRAFVCAILNSGSTAEEIIDAILKALGSIIPGGIIIAWIVKKIVKYLISRGIGAFCGI